FSGPARALKSPARGSPGSRGGTMTDTEIREAAAGPPSPPSRRDGASPYGEAEKHKAGPGPSRNTFCIGPWILLFLGKAARADYQRQVPRLNSKLTEYLEATDHLSVSDRQQIRERLPSFYRLPGAFWFIRDLTRFRPDEGNPDSPGQGASQGDGGQQRGRQL